MANTMSVFGFMKMYPDEKTARDFSIDYRWNGEVKCLHGNHDKITTLKHAGFFRYRKCRWDFTAKTGAVMEKSKVDIRTWLFAMYCVVARKSISSLARK